MFVQDIEIHATCRNWKFFLRQGFNGPSDSTEVCWFCSSPSFYALWIFIWVQRQKFKTRSRAPFELRYWNILSITRLHHVRPSSIWAELKKGKNSVIPLQGNRAFTGSKNAFNAACGRVRLCRKDRDIRGIPAMTCNIKSAKFGARNLLPLVVCIKIGRGPLTSLAFPSGDAKFLWMNFSDLPKHVVLGYFQVCTLG